MSIEVIESWGIMDFEDKINEAIENVEVQDIKYSTSICRDGTVLYSAMIIFC